MGLAICLVLALGCPAPWKPTPETPTGPPPPDAPLIEWNAGSGLLRCRSAAITVPAPLRSRVRWRTPHELTIVPAASPPGGALVVTLMEAVAEDGPFKFLQDSPRMWIDLHLLAIGGGAPSADGGAVDSEATLRVQGNLDENGDRVVAEYDVGDQHGRLILLQVGRCRIRALDFPFPGTGPTLTALLEGL